jgi:hypothetical protein
LIEHKDSTPINGTENARIIKFETLRPLDASDTIVEFDNSIQHSICRLDQVAASHHPTVSSSSPILHHTHHSPAQVQIITTCPSPVTSLSELGLKNQTIITTAQMSHEDNRTIEHHHHHHQQHQQHQQHHQENNHHQNNHQQQVHHQIVQHVIHHQHQQPQQITIHQQQQQQSRPIIHHHQIIETIKTEDVDIKPSIHELMSVGSMDVDAQQSNNGENVHGIVVTPEIGNMMTTPTQIGKILPS